MTFVKLGKFGKLYLNIFARRLGRLRGATLALCGVGVGRLIGLFSYVRAGLAALVVRAASDPQDTRCCAVRDLVRH